MPPKNMISVLENTTCRARRHCAAALRRQSDGAVPDALRARRVPRPEDYRSRVTSSGSGIFSYSYASQVTSGVSSKLKVGGGDDVLHSRPVAPQGLSSAILP